MRYESQISVISEELQSLQSQVTRFKRERDTYKHMLEGAQKTIGELKHSPGKSGRDSRASIASFDEVRCLLELNDYVCFFIFNVILHLS